MRCTVTGGSRNGPTPLSAAARSRGRQRWRSCPCRATAADGRGARRAGPDAKCSFGHALCLPTITMTVVRVPTLNNTPWQVTVCMHNVSGGCLDGSTGQRVYRANASDVALRSPVTVPCDSEAQPRPQRSDLGLAGDAYSRCTRLSSDAAKTTATILSEATSIREQGQEQGPGAGAGTGTGTRAGTGTGAGAGAHRDRVRDRDRGRSGGRVRGRGRSVI